MKKIIIIISTIFFISSFFVISPAHAQNQIAENNSVSAIVPSEVSTKNSRAILNTSSTLADPINHTILLTIKLADSDNVPLKNLSVMVTSDRGAVDIIEATSKIGTNNLDMNKDMTNANGQTSFRITSWVPGKTTINILADNLIHLPNQNIEFLALPFPAQITISVSIPLINKKIFLLSPLIPAESLTNTQKEAEKFASIGTEISIPFWIIFLAVFFIIIVPFFMFLGFINLRKVRKSEKKEAELIKKTATHNDINSLKQEINNRFDK